VAAGARLGVPQVPVIPITTAEYPTPAKRPANSRLDCGKLERIFGLRLPPWQQGVEDCITELRRCQTLRV
jgi:dTDP-4-dehydrorhamnose reductase